MATPSFDQAQGVPILLTKLHAPPVRPELVSRPRLIEQLDAGLGPGSDFARKLTLICAPAGFGKTTLLSEWTSRFPLPITDSGISSDDNLGEEGQRTAIGWLSLDQGENDLVRFLSYIVGALRTIEVQPGAVSRIGERVLAAFHAPEPPPIEWLLTDLLNEIAEMPCRVLLILDDCHLVTAQSIHTALIFFLEHLPGNLHLAIATRADPPLPIARLRGRGQVTEVRQADLRFTTQEAAAFLGRVLTQDLPTEDILALTTRTEGWIAGLQMATLALKGLLQQGSTPQSQRVVAPAYELREKEARLSWFIRAFKGSHRYILDYLLEEVLSQQPAGIQDFLLQTSILNRLSGPLCDAVLATGDCRLEIDKDGVPLPIPNIQRPASGSQQILDYLESANLFLCCLDEERRWYRYHRLFADLLQQRLEWTHPERAQYLHRRASEWYEQEGMLAEAVGHALAAGEWERAAGLIEEGAEATLMRGEVATFLGWVEKLPEEQVRARPPLCVLVAWSLLVRGEPLDAVEARLQDAAGARDSAPVLSRETDSAALDGRLTLIRAMILMTQGYVARASELARRAFEQLPEEDLFWRSAATWTLGTSRSANGDLRERKRDLEGAARKAQERGNAMIAVAALGQLARVCMRQGQLGEARSLYEQALALARDSQGRMLPIAGDALIGLGELQREWNHLESAARYLVEGIKLASQWRKLGALYGHISLARVRQAQGEALGALEALQNAKQIAVRFDATDLDDQIVALQQAGLWIAQGNLSAAMSWAADRGLDGNLRLAEFCEETDAPDHHLRKYEQVMLARLWNARNRPERALTALESLLPRMEAEGRIGLVIEIQMLRALAFQAQGDREAALVALEQALSLAEPESYVRLFADEGEPMARLLYLAASRGITPAYAAGLLESLGEVPRETMSPHTDSATLLEPLTPRETDVMRYLVTGLSTPEIAREMFVATSTVRTHVKSIYGKLGVHKRWEAVQQAEMLGLL